MKHHMSMLQYSVCKTALELKKTLSISVMKILCKQWGKIVSTDVN